MKILINPRLRKSGLGLLAVIIFVALLILVVGTMVYLIMQLAKKLNNPPPPPPDNPAKMALVVTNTDGTIENVYVYTETNTAPQETETPIMSRLYINKLDTAEGKSYPVITYDLSVPQGAFDVTVERSQLDTNGWVPIQTTRIDPRDIALDTTNDFTVLIDTNSGTGPNFYRLNVTPVPSP